jgi:hypothetical protein
MIYKDFAKDEIKWNITLYLGVTAISLTEADCLRGSKETLYGIGPCVNLAYMEC